MRQQIEKLNGVKFTDSEWNRFFKNIIANPNDNIEQKSEKIQLQSRFYFKRDDSSLINLKLIDKDNIHENNLQVINQYEEQNGNHKTRYDVTILVNGLPLVHIELKRRSIKLEEAFNQIERYQRDSFWASSGLFNFVQIFVISNGTYTKYYSNSTRFNITFNKNSRKTKTSNSFEFTSYWADQKNKKIIDLEDFTKTFFSKHTLLNVLTKYCILNEEKTLLVMRPYQIVATEKIINRIEISNNYKTYGSIKAGGYIWHTTGSGKTLTSFKTSVLASSLLYIDKVLFVVDRKDLDYQTMREYENFQKGTANAISSTNELRTKLESNESKIIITTIQKLANFVKQNKKSSALNKHVVLIFDECHRSQFGEMHKDITKAFSKYHLFGFTGTPIFNVNQSNASKYSALKTTEQIFGDKLHTYTIVNAIDDGNVLPFKYSYVKTIHEKENIIDKDVEDIHWEKVYSDPRYIEQITKYILEHFEQATYRKGNPYEFKYITNISEMINTNKYGRTYESKEKRKLKGFNSILCVSSIEIAKKYYEEFKKQMELNPDKKIKIATIFSFAPNESEDSFLLEENSESTSNLDLPSREFLENAIKDYNKMFGTSYDTSSDKFQNYYKDVSMRIKNRDIDLLIVVNMFLTGFDSTTLNTLWVDKDLKLHGLIQAFSRTNRILNKIKTFGNIISFRNLEKRTNEAIALFGDEKASGICLLRTFNDYYNGYENNLGYVQLIEQIKTSFPLPNIPFGEKQEKQFIQIFGKILKMINLLSSFDEFTNDKRILNERDMQDYQGIYLTLQDKWRKNKIISNQREDITDDVVFETELVKQYDINIDLILYLVKQYKLLPKNNEEIRIKIEKAIESSPTLRSKKELIHQFIQHIMDEDDIFNEWKEFISKNRETDLNKIINEENLNPSKTKSFMQSCFENNQFKTIGNDINEILPPTSLFGVNNRFEKKKLVTDKLLVFFDKYSNI